MSSSYYKVNTFVTKGIACDKVILNIFKGKLNSKLQTIFQKNNNTFSVFLALLDFVSRAHEIEICPWSVVRPSVRRLSSVVRLWIFLALLDYVSGTHEIEIRPSYVVRPSVRPSVASIISEVTAWIAFKFHMWLPLGHMPRRFFQIFFFFFDFLGIFFSFSLKWDPMGAQTSKCYSSLKSLSNPFKLFLNFLSNRPHKSMFGIFEILKIEILTNFIRFR